MRSADAELQLWLANDRLAREYRDMEMAQLARDLGATPTLRQRAGQAVIALGERLAGTGVPPAGRIDWRRGPPDPGLDPGHAPPYTHRDPRSVRARVPVHSSGSVCG
jgi:hypothetical protein